MKKSIVSRLWPERIRITLLPREAELVRMRAGPGAAVTERRTLSCEPRGGPHRWSGAVEAARAFVSDAAASGGELSVVLSNHFVRYQVLPWSPQIVTEQEETAVAGARFVQVYGPQARGWAVAVNPARAGAARLAAAVDDELLGALGQLAQDSALRLISIQPALMTLANRWRRHIGSDAWLIVVECGWIVVGRISTDEWVSVRGRPMSASPVPLRDVVEQEQALSGDYDNRRIFVANLDFAACSVEGMTLDKVQARNRADPGAGYALATCGY